MTHTISSVPIAEAAPTKGGATPAPRTTPTKSAQILTLLGRASGATAAQLVEATGWQPHTVRAHLTRLRQRGTVLERVERKAGPAAYRIVREPPAQTAAPTVSTDEA